MKQTVVIIAMLCGLAFCQVVAPPVLSFTGPIKVPGQITVLLSWTASGKCFIQKKGPNTADYHKLWRERETDIKSYEDSGLIVGNAYLYKVTCSGVDSNIVTVVVK
jgi:hypothetical protein